MSVSGRIAIRRDAVARAPYALLEAIEAAISLGVQQHAHRHELWEREEDDPALGEAQKKFAETQHAAVETLATVCKEADAFRAMSERPQTIIQAMNALAGAQKFFALAVDEYLTRLEAWRMADTQTGRIRVAVAERIQKDNGISASAADKAASGDPEYTRHKDQCAMLSEGKDAAEYEMKVAELNVKSAVATLEAFIALQKSPPFTLDSSSPPKQEIKS